MAVQCEHWIAPVRGFRDSAAVGITPFAGRGDELRACSTWSSRGVGPVAIGHPRAGHDIAGGVSNGWPRDVSVSPTYFYEANLYARGYAIGARSAKGRRIVADCLVGLHRDRLDAITVG